MNRQAKRLTNALNTCHGPIRFSSLYKIYLEKKSSCFIGNIKLLLSLFPAKERDCVYVL